MARTFALVENGIVTNVIRAEAWPGGIDVTDLTPRPGPGWLYDGTTFTPPPAPAPVPVNAIQRAALLKRMTPVELHGWLRAAQRAQATNTPVDADRNALYAWVRWQSMDGIVDLSSDDIQGLKSVWVALGMTQARADALLTPLVSGA